MKELVWTVTSAKMKNTVVVTVETVKKDPIYKKRFVVKKKYYAHNEDDSIAEWSSVKIRQHKPISKLKRWIVVK